MSATRFSYSPPGALTTTPAPGSLGSGSRTMAGTASTSPEPVLFSRWWES